MPRIMLLSVPYALKAADAETFGGKPPSAYAPAITSEADSTAGVSTTAVGSGGGPQNLTHTPHPLPLSGSGTPQYLSLWTSASNLTSSVLYQSGGGYFGIGTQIPIAQFDSDNAGGNAILGITHAASFSGITGLNMAASDVAVGVYGRADSSSGTGVYGNAAAVTNGTTYGVAGTSSGATGAGVYGAVTLQDGEGVLGLNSSTSGIAYGVEGSTASTSGIAVFGVATAATGEATGVQGTSNSTSGEGVLGIAVANSGTAIAVLGNAYSPTGSAGLFVNNSTTGNAVGLGGGTLSPGGIGIIGEGVAHSETGLDLTDRPIGVWGDTDQDGDGVVGTADDAVGVLGLNDAPNLAAGEFENDEIDSHIAPVVLAHNAEYHGLCTMDVSGNLTCTGSKSAAVPVDGGSRMVALYAVEAPENWFEDVGSGRLANGSAVVLLESLFAQTINSDVEYHVFLTPTGDCKGLYVSNKTANGFEVHELGGGISNIGFDYRIMARRKGYENIRLEDRTAVFNPANLGKKRMGRGEQARPGGKPQPVSDNFFRRKAAPNPAISTLKFQQLEHSFPSPPVTTPENKKRK